MPVVPMMSLHFKRAKSFTATVDGGTRKFLAQPGFVAQQVPFWVANTATFQQGIKDGSIVNLTPPALMPGLSAWARTNCGKARKISPAKPEKRISDFMALLELIVMGSGRSEC